MGDWELGLWVLAALVAVVFTRLALGLSDRPFGLAPDGRIAVDPPARESPRLDWPPGIPRFAGRLARAAPF